MFTASPELLPAGRPFHITSHVGHLTPTRGLFAWDGRRSGAPQPGSYRPDQEQTGSAEPYLRGRARRYRLRKNRGK
jgi:hypothetical protein